MTAHSGIASAESTSPENPQIFQNSEKVERGSLTDIKKPQDSAAGDDSEETLDAGSENTIDDPWKKFHEEIPDGGLLAWTQVAGSFFLFFNSWGIINSFGVFQTYYQANLLSTHNPSTISWIGSVQSFLLLIVGAVSGRFADAGYMRQTIAMGGLCICLGLMLTSLSTEFYQIFLAQGILTGVGGGLAFTPGATTASHWFLKRRALAMGVAATGSSIGGVIYPITMRHLITQIGFPWAVRVCAFIALATMSFAVVVMRSRIPPRPFSEGGGLEYRAFKEPVYALFSIGCFLGFMGIWVPFFFIGGYAKSHGVDEDMAFYLVSIMNAASTFGRVLPNIVADRIGGMNMFVPFAGLSSMLIILLQCAKSETGLIVYAIFYGFLSGSFVSLPPVVVASITSDFSKLGSRLGMAFTFCSFSILIGPPIAGAIISREGGAYTGAFVYAGVIGMTGSAIVGAARVCKTGWKLKKKA